MRYFKKRKYINKKKDKYKYIYFKEYKNGKHVEIKKEEYYKNKQKGGGININEYFSNLSYRNLDGTYFALEDPTLLFGSIQVPDFVRYTTYKYNSNPEKLILTPKSYKELLELGLNDYLEYPEFSLNRLIKEKNMFKDTYTLIYVNKNISYIGYPNANNMGSSVIPYLNRQRETTITQLSLNRYLLTIDAKKKNLYINNAISFTNKQLEHGSTNILSLSNLRQMAYNQLKLLKTARNINNFLSFIVFITNYKSMMEIFTLDSESIHIFIEELNKIKEDVFKIFRLIYPGLIIERYVCPIVNISLSSFVITFNLLPYGWGQRVIAGKVGQFMVLSDFINQLLLVATLTERSFPILNFGYPALQKKYSRISPRINDTTRADLEATLLSLPRFKPEIKFPERESNIGSFFNVISKTNMNERWNGLKFKSLRHIQQWLKWNKSRLITSSRQTIYDKKLKKGLWVMLIKSGEYFYQINLFGLASGFSRYKRWDNLIETFNLVFADKNVDLYEVKWKKVSISDDYLRNFTSNVNEKQLGIYYKQTPSEYDKWRKLAINGFLDNKDLQIISRDINNIGTQMGNYLGIIGHSIVCVDNKLFLMLPNYFFVLKIYELLSNKNEILLLITKQFDELKIINLRLYNLVFKQSLYVGWWIPQSLIPLVLLMYYIPGYQDVKLLSDYKLSGIYLRVKTQIDIEFTDTFQKLQSKIDSKKIRVDEFNLLYSQLRERKIELLEEYLTYGTYVNYRRGNKGMFVGNYPLQFILNEIKNASTSKERISSIVLNDLGLDIKVSCKDFTSKDSNVIWVVMIMMLQVGIMLKGVHEIDGLTLDEILSWRDVNDISKNKNNKLLLLYLNQIEMYFHLVYKVDINRLAHVHFKLPNDFLEQIVIRLPVSYTHLTLPTNREV